MMRSAWIKWARAVEHQRVLARHTREFAAAEPYEYVRVDNAADHSDPYIRAHWRLKIKQPYPERWSVAFGDVLTNLRAALDHAFWAAAVAHSGQPAKPQLLQFPIATDAGKFTRMARDLRPLVPDPLWSLIDRIQPFHGGDIAHTSPFETLRWLSNVDKHRFVHVVGRTYFDFGAVHIGSDAPIEVIDEWRREGLAEDNSVIVRLKLKRPAVNGPIDLTPTFAHAPTVQISDAPVEYRSLDSVMEKMTEAVLEFLFEASSALDIALPELNSLEVGEEHDAHLPEFGGQVFRYRDVEGTVHHFRLPADQPGQPDADES